MKDKKEIVSFQVSKKDEGIKLKEFLNIYLEETKSKIKKIIRMLHRRLENDWIRQKKI
mgnify:CR=1 FL=1